MTKLQRFNSFAGGLLTVLLGLLLYEAPYMGTDIIALILAVSLMILGVKNLIFYAAMSRHMVGGKVSLFYGLILTDLGIYLYSIKDFSPMYVMLYLLVIYSFYGATDIVLALQARKLKSRSWRIKLLTGIGNLSLGILAMVFGLTGETVFNVIYIYALGLAYTGIMRMANAFRRTAVPYIQ